MVEGWLLINLGSPDGPTSGHVRRYLREFLMDRHVIDLHWTLRAALVHGVIAPVRAPRSAKAYQAIWTEHGSPLLHNSVQFAEKVESLLHPAPVELAMRYGRPSVAAAFARLRKAGVTRLNVVPLYPQFAKSSTLTAVESVLKENRRSAGRIEMRFLQDFYTQPEWIESLAENIRHELSSFNADYLLFSYHGLPEHHIRELDHKNYCLSDARCCEGPSDQRLYCYRSQCFATTGALLTALSWPRGKYQISFQSRLGRRPWIKPYSDHVIVELAKKGKKRVLVACPSFVADCLETLEEVAIRLREDFRAHGGEDLRLVPAVNGSEVWAKSFVRMIKRPDLNWLDEAAARRLPFFT